MTGKPNKWTETTFEEIEEWRRSRGLTKLNVAGLIGISNSCYHNWRRGLNAPNLGTQARIRRLIDAHPTQLQMFPTGAPPASAEVRARRMDALAQALGRPAGTLASLVPSPAQPHRWAGENPSCLVRGGSSAPGNREATSMNDTCSGPRLPVQKHYYPGAEISDGYQTATDADIRAAVLRLTSAALSAGVKVAPEDLPSLVKGLRRALT